VPDNAIHSDAMRRRRRVIEMEKSYLLMPKCGRNGSAKERAEITEKVLEGDEQCGNAERMDETVV